MKKKPKTRRFIASVKWAAAGDMNPSAAKLPAELRGVCERRVDDEAARKIVSRYLTANFVNDRVDELFAIEDDVAAIEVEAYGLHFRDGEILPRLKANAAFELPVTKAFDDVDDLEEWQEDNDLYFNDVVNFFWTLPLDGWDGVLGDNEGASFEAAE